MEISLKKKHVGCWSPQTGPEESTKPHSIPGFSSRFWRCTKSDVWSISLRVPFNICLYLYIIYIYRSMYTCILLYSAAKFRRGPIPLDCFTPQEPSVLRQGIAKNPSPRRCIWRTGWKMTHSSSALSSDRTVPWILSCRDWRWWGCGRVESQSTYGFQISSSNKLIEIDYVRAFKAGYGDILSFPSAAVFYQTCSSLQ